jgi:hypothetical protein
MLERQLGLPGNTQRLAAIETTSDSAPVLTTKIRISRFDPNSLLFTGGTQSADLEEVEEPVALRQM